MRHIQSLFVGLTLVLAGCGAPASDPNAGGDAGNPDASAPVEAGRADGGTIDASDGSTTPPTTDAGDGGLACGVLASGQELAQGQQIASCNDEGFGAMELDMQTDGNFVLYQSDVCRQPTWASSTNGKGGTKAIMQTDGDLVVVDASNSVLWHSNTAGNPGAHLAIQGDGNLVIYTTANKPIWDTGTWHPKPKNKLWIAQDGATKNSAIETYWHMVLEMSQNFTRMEENWSTGRALEFGGYKVLGSACSVVHSTSATTGQDSSTLQCIENQTGWSISSGDVILYYPQGYGCQDGRNHWNITISHGGNAYSVTAAFGFTGSGSECQEALGSHEVYEASAQWSAGDCCNGQDGCAPNPSPYGWYSFSKCGTTWWAQAVSPTPGTEYTSSACTKLSF